MVVNSSTSLQYNIWLRNINASLPQNLSLKYAALLRHLYGHFDGELPFPGMRFRRRNLLLTPPIEAENDDDDGGAGNNVTSVNNDAGVTMLFHAVVEPIHLKLSCSVCVAVLGLGAVLWGLLDAASVFECGAKIDSIANALWRRWRRTRRRWSEESAAAIEENASINAAAPPRPSQEAATPLLGRKREGIV